MSIRIQRIGDDTVLYEAKYIEGMRGKWEPKYTLRGDFDLELPVILDEHGEEVDIWKWDSDSKPSRMKHQKKKG
jgi:hypothetical protein